MTVPTKILFLIAFFLAAASCQPAWAQNGVAHIQLVNGRAVSGYVLSVRDTAVVLQADIKRFEAEYHSVVDVPSICRNATLVRFRDIQSFTLERSSAAWLIPLLGTPALCYILGDYVLHDPNEGKMGHDHDEFVFGTVVIGTLLGAIGAVIVSALTASDLDILVYNQDDLERLKSYALFQGEEPPELRALH